MKNNKGFTLVEILAVIVIIAIFAVIGAPAVLDALEAGRHGIDEINKKNLTDAAETIILDVINCNSVNHTFDDTIPALDLSSVGSTCNDVYQAVMGETITTTVGNIVDAGYFIDEHENCKRDGEIKITTNDQTYKVTVDLSDVECRKD